MMQYSRIFAVAVLSTNMQPLQLYSFQILFFDQNIASYSTMHNIRFVRGSLEPQFVYFSTGVSWIAPLSCRLSRNLFFWCQFHLCESNDAFFAEAEPELNCHARHCNTKFTKEPRKRKKKHNDQNKVL